MKASILQSTVDDCISEVELKKISPESVAKAKALIKGKKNTSVTLDSDGVYLSLTVWSDGEEGESNERGRELAREIEQGVPGLEHIDTNKNDGEDQISFEFIQK